MTESRVLLDERDTRFLLYEVFDAERLCRLPHFADHSRETFDLYIGAAARLARDAVFPTYKPMDEDAPRFEDGRVLTHPAMRALYPQLVELGLLGATRPYEVDGQQLPLAVASLAAAHVMAANASAYGYCMLTSGAAHLIESFGSAALKDTFMRRMYAGEWAGTMALTEPQAGSSLAEVATRARPSGASHHLMQGSKVFISGGDQSVTENIVHLVLARIDGAPAGVKGISLFAVPRLRLEGERLVDNHARATGAFHKLGWRGIPSIALDFGGDGECHGYLVGEANRGLAYMFQMMNEARIHIGLHAVATAGIAYREALAYARTRIQGRPPGSLPGSAPRAIIGHADVRRMLLRQKAIVEGGLALVLATARYADLAAFAETPGDRAHAQDLLDLLTPLAKTFPSEKGFEANALAIQVHGGYGYTSEYLPEAWLRDQKLNSIHEGTTGIQSQDLLGRKVLKGEGRSIAALCEEMRPDIVAARDAGLHELAEPLEEQVGRLRQTTDALVAMAERGPDTALAHAVDYLELVATVVVAWQWLRMADAATRGMRAEGRADDPFYRGKLQAARYYFATELPRVRLLAELCEGAEDSYTAMRDEWF